MTSNYDKYIQPETWPVPVEEIGCVFAGRRLPDGLVEILCAGDLGKFTAGQVFILGTVPCKHAGGVLEAIITYRNACRKLIGHP